MKANTKDRNKRSVMKIVNRSERREQDQINFKINFRNKFMKKFQRRLKLNNRSILVFQK